MQESRKILYIAPYWNTFIRSDFELLARSNEVIPIVFGNKHDGLIPLYFVRQFFLILAHSISKNTLFFIQFGGYHSLLPTLFSYFFGNASYVVVHGTDACSFKAINYGILRKPLLRLFCKFTFRLCTKILPVSHSLVVTQNDYFSQNETLQFGIHHEFPEIPLKKIEVIHNGLDSSCWPLENLYKRHTFVTVAGGQSIKQLRKGIDLILKCAEELPNYTFLIVGLKEFQTTTTNNNVTFIPKTNQKELIKIYNESTFYLQLSIFEGFGLALCEAMLCGCVPIVSKANMLPEIIGSSGFVLEKRDSALFKKLLNEAATKAESELRQRAKLARARIESEYPILKREKAIENILKQIN